MAISKCKRCGAIVYDGSPLCPECNERHNEVYNTRLWSDKKVKKPEGDISYFTILVIIIAFFTILPIAYKILQTLNPEKGVSTASVDYDKKLDFVGEIKTSRDEYQIIFEGVVRNNSSKEVTFIRVSFNLLDKDGNVLEVVSDYLPNLKAGATWKFSAKSYTEEVLDNAVKYELNELSGF